VGSTNRVGPGGDRCNRLFTKAYDHYVLRFFTIARRKRGRREELGDEELFKPARNRQKEVTRRLGFSSRVYPGITSTRPSPTTHRYFIRLTKWMAGTKTGHQIKSERSIFRRLVAS